MTTDPITCDCYSARLKQTWTGVRNRRYPNSGVNDLNCYKYDVDRCDGSSWYGSVIFGTGRAQDRCLDNAGLNLKPLIYSVTGQGHPKYSLRENGRSALQGIQVDAGWYDGRYVKICLDASINEMQTKGYISFGFGGAQPDDFVSCQVRNRLPDFCAGTATDTDVYLHVGDNEDEQDIFVVPEGYDVVLPNQQMNFINNGPNNMVFSDNINNGIVALIAVLMMAVMFVLFKWVIPKWKNRGYDKIDSSSDEEEEIAISSE